MLKILNISTPIVLLLVVLFFTSQLKANQPPCEVWNYDTEQCETFAEQNLTVNPEWVTFH